MARQRDIRELLVGEDLSIKKVMQIIDRTALNIAFVVDRDCRLIGAVSDGDIRRAILRGCDVGTAVKEVMNGEPVFLHEHQLANRYLVTAAVKKLRAGGGGCPPIPVVDAECRPVQLADFRELTRVTAMSDDGPKRDNRVLVVGGAGFLGSVLVGRLLQKGYTVRVLDSLLYGRQSIEAFIENSRFEPCEGDMRDISVLAGALKQVGAVVNLAAIVGDPACKASPSTTIETNYLANKVLAEACKYNQINRFIFASTCSVYGASREVVDETSDLHPLSLYTRSKIHSEEGILSLEDENFAPTILRMATLYGYSPRMRFDLVVNTMVKDAFSTGRITIHGGGTQWRPLLEVSDAAEAYILCLEAPLERIKGEIFNLGAEKQNYQILDIAAKVRRHLPGAELHFAGEMFDARDYSVCFKKIRRQLNFRPRKGLNSAIIEIKRALHRDIADVDDDRYYNVRRIQDVGVYARPRAAEYATAGAASVDGQGT